MASLGAVGENDVVRRCLDAGRTLTQTTRARAEAVVGELRRTGEAQWEQAQGRVEELVGRSRRSTEHLMSVVRDEVARQLSTLGLASKEDVARLEARLDARLDAVVTRLSRLQPADAGPPEAARPASAGPGGAPAAGTEATGG